MFPLCGFVCRCVTICRRGNKATTYRLNQEALAASDAVTEYKAKSGTGTASAGGIALSGSRGTLKRHSDGKPLSGRGVHATGVGSPVPFDRADVSMSPITPAMPDWTAGPSAAVALPLSLTRKMDRDAGRSAVEEVPPAPGWTACGSLGISSKVKVSMLEVRGNQVYDMLRRSHGYVRVVRAAWSGGGGVRV